MELRRCLDQEMSSFSRVSIWLVKHFPSSSLEVGLSRNSSSRRSRSACRKAAKSRSASCEKYGRATFSSMSRSRSTSPFALDTPCEERPPFVVRKAEFSKIAGRTPGMKKVDNKYTKKLKSRSPSPRRRQTYGSYCSEQCIHCNGDFPESDCMLCRVYRRYSGKPYSEHYDQLCCLQRKGLKSCDISCEYDPPMSSYQTALHHSLSPENTVTGVSSSSSFLSSFKPTSQYALGYDTLDALAMDLQRAKDRRYY